MPNDHAFNQPDPQHQGDQTAAAITDERERDARHRNQVQVNGNIHHRLEENQDGDPIGNKSSKRIARQVRRADSDKL